jgi:acyl-coenzyme A synthetase/AMP-(fatty) acid ligase
MLDILAVPATATLVASDSNPDTAMDWAALRAEVRRRAAEVPSVDPRRQVFGINAGNGVETLLQILSVIEAGGIAAPMPVETEPTVVERAFDRLNAAGVWTAHGWQPLAGTRRYGDGFDLVMHSSGSTGIPKPLAIRLQAMHRNAWDVAHALQLNDEDVHLGTFSHCYMSGLYNSTILPLVTGARSVAAPAVTALTTGPLVDALYRHRPTILWVSPLVARLLSSLRGVPREALESVRMAISCTAPLPVVVKERFEERFAVPLLQSYGLCETLIATVENRAAPSAGSVGRPVGPPGAVTVDDQGQIVISNGAHFCGYLEEGREHLRRSPVGPYETGDTGRIDGAGNLHVTGRLSETINRDGVKFAPEIVEAIMNTMPGVQDSALLGVDDHALGVRLVALVVGAAAPVSQLHDTLRERLPIMQRPHEIRVVEELPRTASGKIDRVALRKRIVADAP